MELTRRTLLERGALAAIGAALAPASAAQDRFDIDAAFAQFMADLGQSPNDAVGKVTFTGGRPDPAEPFPHRTAMAAAVGVAIWQARTGQPQDVSPDLREAVYNVNPLLAPIMQFRLAMGAAAPDDPVAKGFTFIPTINGNLYQAPVGLGNPFSFVPFRPRDGRFMTSPPPIRT